MRAKVVLTIRSGEPAPDAVTALWKDGHLRTLEVLAARYDRGATMTVMDWEYLLLTACRAGPR